MRNRGMFYNVCALFILCLNIIMLFTVLYAILDVLNLGLIVDHHSPEREVPAWIDHGARTIYFSAITLLSVGYGDITPFGWSRGVAILEATVGYILPAAITVQYLKLFPAPLEKWFKNRQDPPEKPKD
jgi:potassium channel LctB